MCRIELDEFFKSFIGINALERFHSVGNILFLLEFSNVIQEILVSFSKSLWLQVMLYFLALRLIRMRLPVNF
jgi:hypothetical protein